MWSQVKSACMIDAKIDGRTRDMLMVGNTPNTNLLEVAQESTPLHSETSE